MSSNRGRAGGGDFHDTGSGGFRHISTIMSFETYMRTNFYESGGYHPTGPYVNTARPRQCPGCGAWKTVERHGRRECAYCGNPA